MPAVYNVKKIQLTADSPIRIGRMDVVDNNGVSLVPQISSLVDGARTNLITLTTTASLTGSATYAAPITIRFSTPQTVGGIHLFFYTGTSAVSAYGIVAFDSNDKIIGVGNATYGAWSTWMLDTTQFTFSNATVTTSTEAHPFRTGNAYRFNETAVANAEHYMFQSSSSSNQYARRRVWMVAKAAERTRIALSLYGPYGGNMFDLTDGSVLGWIPDPTKSQPAVTQSLGNGWWLLYLESLANVPGPAYTYPALMSGSTTNYNGVANYGIHVAAYGFSGSNPEEGLDDPFMAIKIYPVDVHSDGFLGVFENKTNEGMTINKVKAANDPSFTPIPTSPVNTLIRSGKRIIVTPVSTHSNGIGRIYDASIHGTITASGVPVSTMVMLFEAVTMRNLGGVMSSLDGTYRFSNLDPIKRYTVCVRSPTGGIVPIKGMTGIIPCGWMQPEASDENGSAEILDFDVPT